MSQTTSLRLNCGCWWIFCPSDRKVAKTPEKLHQAFMLIVKSWVLSCYSFDIIPYRMSNNWPYSPCLLSGAPVFPPPGRSRHSLAPPSPLSSYPWDPFPSLYQLLQSVLFRFMPCEPAHHRVGSLVINYQIQTGEMQIFLGSNSWEKKRKNQD